MIVVVGIYLRTYHFHDWLYFYPDQARDVMVVSDYLNGKAPLPLMGFRAASTFFDLGAMYYYFQIISGKIFGVAPNTMAYPDLFFNILAIPLFYYFLKRYFRTDISLALTAIYAVSYYAIEFSRFAWNPNPMPFFVLLFLLSLSKLLAEKEKTHWGWILGIGIAVGVGIQLHTILIFLFISVTLVAFVISMKSNWRLWKRWLLVFAVILVLNTNQVISESSHHFSNSKKLFHLSSGSLDKSAASGRFSNLALDAVCHVQANAHIVSSLGNKVDCDYVTTAVTLYQQRLLGFPVDPKIFFGLAASLLFSLFGYGLMIYYYLREKDQKRKDFLGLICLYIGLCFIILYPVIAEPHLRYFLQLFFVPYLFLGFLLEHIRKKYAKMFAPAILGILVLLGGFNLSTLSAEAKLYETNNHSRPQYVVLGDLLHMRDYIASQTNPQKTVYMIADGKYMQNYYLPLFYVLQQDNIKLVRELKDYNAIPPDVPLFSVAMRSYILPVVDTKGFPVKQFQNFGEIGIYMLDNQKSSRIDTSSPDIDNNK
jgi:4-amino-4-deoxy-L-arabinose transferase-like glycosyltransferase